MFKLLKNKRAQNTAEYAILIGVVVAAAVAMQTYVKRGIQGQVKDKVDGLGTQYEPYYLSSNFNNTNNATDTENTALGGGVARTSNQATTRAGTQTYGAAQ